MYRMKEGFFLMAQHWWANSEVELSWFDSVAAATVE